jgi:glucose-1-phosphate thymidylyltransferase
LIGCPEEVAYLQGYITAEHLRTLAAKYHSSAYGRYLRHLLDDGQTLPIAQHNKSRL